MSVPSPVKIKRNGVEYTSNVDRINYTITELSRAALRDVGKLIRKRTIQELQKLPGLRRLKRPYSSVQTWVRKIESDLLIGIKHNTWYGVEEELGSSKMPKKAFLLKTTNANIDEVRKIEGMYLSAIEDESKALSLISEEEYKDEDK